MHHSLSAVYREVLILRDVQCLTIKEATAILGISAANVKTRFIARLLLRDKLAPGSTVAGSKDNPIGKSDMVNKEAEWQPLK